MLPLSEAGRAWQAAQAVSLSGNACASQFTHLSHYRIVPIQDFAGSGVSFYPMFYPALILVHVCLRRMPHAPRSRSIQDQVYTCAGAEPAASRERCLSCKKGASGDEGTRRRAEGDSFRGG